jgi:hypothetical protein
VGDGALKEIGVMNEIEFDELNAKAISNFLGPAPGVRCAHPGLYAAVRSADSLRFLVLGLLLAL